MSRFSLGSPVGRRMDGGEGFILQKLEGDGMAFVHAGGTVVKKELKDEPLRGHRLSGGLHAGDRL